MLVHFVTARASLFIDIEHQVFQFVSIDLSNICFKVRLFTVFLNGRQQIAVFKIGPILVLLRSHPLTRVPFSLRDSRHKCCICCPSSIARVWVLIQQSSNPHHDLDNFWSFDTCSKFRSYSCRRFLHCCSLVEFSASEWTVGISTFAKCSGAAGFSGALIPSNESAVAP